MQGVGMVNDYMVTCFCYREVMAALTTWRKHS